MMEPTTGDAQFAVACTTEQETLGEGARWDAERSEFLHVDIVRGLVWRHRVRSDGTLSLVRSYGEPGAIAPIRGDDGWLLAAGRGFRHLAPDGTVSMVTDVAPPGTRMNDAVCDPAGRCWAGSLADDHAGGGGALHRLHPDGTTHRPRRSDHPERHRLEPGRRHDVSGRQRPGRDPRIRPRPLDRVDRSRTRIRHVRRRFRHSRRPHGDRAGRLWVAIYGGCVHCYAPDGTLEEVLRIPAEQTTSMRSRRP
jgi:sugar lactone lactonase YvrE